MHSMLHRVLVLLAVLGLTLGTAGNAVAGVLSAPDSTFTLQLGGLAPITITGTYTLGGTATLTNNGGSHNLADTPGIWSTVGNSPGTSLFTGVNLITDLVLTAGNGAGNFTPAFSVANSVAGNQTGTNATPYSGTVCPSGCLGGTETVTGQTVVYVGGFGVPFANTVIGVGGTNTIMLTTMGQTIAATGGPFVTGKVRITNITSNVVQLPNRVPVATGPAILPRSSIFWTLPSRRISNSGSRSRKKWMRSVNSPAASRMISITFWRLSAAISKSRPAGRKATKNVRSTWNARSTRSFAGAS